jgi:CDP-diacylglycerol pyrophosphatase
MYASTSPLPHLMPILRPGLGSFFLVLACLALSGLPACAANPDALWQIVHDYCEPAALGVDVQQKCIAVDPGAGFAVLKDINGNTQYLLIPTTRVEGIESPELLAPGSPNYWRDAWQARRYVEAKLGHPLPRNYISLAINSTSGRSQDQLHIHIDCLAPGVVRALSEHAAAIGTDWSPFPTLLHGHPYRVRRIDDANLTSTDPFKLIAQDVAREGQSMADQTLLLVGATAPDGKPAFYLLQDHVRRDSGDFASAEELQDHSCAVGRDDSLAR